MDDDHGYMTESGPEKYERRLNALGDESCLLLSIRIPKGSSDYHCCLRIKGGFERAQSLEWQRENGKDRGSIQIKFVDGPREGVFL
jgi:hypothetical protein